MAKSPVGVKIVSVINDLYEVALAADPSIVGVALVDPPYAENWYVTERGDGLNVRLDTSTGNPPNNAAVNAVLTLDLSPEAVAARQANRERAAAVSAFLTDISPMARCMRAVIGSVILNEINLLRAAQCVGTASGTWDAPNMANGAGALAPTMTVPGAAVDDVVDVVAPGLNVGVIATAIVSAPDTVQVRLLNVSGGAHNPPGLTYYVAVRRPRVLAAYTQEQLVTAMTNAISVG